MNSNYQELPSVHFGMELLYFRTLNYKGNNMGKILMIPVTFAITGIAFCCMASPFLVLGGSFLKGFIG